MNTKEFLLGLPEKINQSALEGLSACFHFELSGDDPSFITISIENGQISSKEGLIGEATCLLKADALDLKKVFKGELNPMMAILTGKLKISNQGEMIKFAKLLGWM